MPVVLVALVLLVSSPAAGQRQLPPPAAASPSAEALRGMSREERVAALTARAWEIRAAWTDEPVSVDGWLDEAAWERARPIGDFYQRESFEGLPSTESTVVRVLHDDQNLYFGFLCTIEDAERNRPRTMFRDENIASDDAVAIMLDAYNAQRSAIFLATNSNGILFDMSQNGQGPETRNLDWDTVWESRGRAFPGGWTVEVRIPLKSLRFRPPSPGTPAAFGVGFKRNIPSKNEEVYWPFVPNDSTWYRPSELGQLVGLRDVQPGRNVEMRPWALGARRGGEEFEGDATALDGGFDVKWGVTPGLTADFTVNTDFAQAEVDDLQQNFTRFSLRFPEKRQIFLEGQRNFQFGERVDADLVFTRRIGLSDAGEPIPIRGGARMSGRQGAWTLGLMGMATGARGETSGERFSVARVRRDVWSRSSVGALFTDRSSELGFNRVAGADVNLFFRRVWSFQGLAARVFDGSDRGGSGIASARLSYDSDTWGGTAKAIGIGERFDPGIGFVPRRGIRKTFFRGRFSPRPAVSWMRQLHFEANRNRTANLAGVVETRRAQATARATFESGDMASFQFVDQYEFAAREHEIQGVTIPAGGYPFRRYQFAVNTFGRRYATLRASWEFGGFWGGTRDVWSLGTNYRINRNLGVRADYSYNRLELPGGDLDTHLVSSRIQLAFRNDLILLGLFQYNEATGDLASNVRFNWIPKPGTDVFLVYTELDEWSSESFFVRNRSLSLKFNYLFRL